MRTQNFTQFNFQRTIRSPGGLLLVRPPASDSDTNRVRYAGIYGIIYTPRSSAGSPRVPDDRIGRRENEVPTSAKNNFRLLRAISGGLSRRWRLICCCCCCWRQYRPIAVFPAGQHLDRAIQTDLLTYTHSLDRIGSSKPRPRARVCVC